MDAFEHAYLYLACTEDTTFFLRDKRSIKSLINSFVTFSKYPSLKKNHEKCEIAGTGVLKSVKVAVCGMKCIDLCNDAIKTRKGEIKKIFRHNKIHNVLKV